ncbi:lipopolysaccharide biosynthesis protein [Flavobacterium selenitireducens]|uniref:lipopolysaccharide biosynthesis protein n=1 Tax=Flavobacterium selenitireducens TaxID=2722704 RepID=UPI00168C09F5|nr:oligosaccharide flippase family protein [Flavobacterium selenitireducens]MBD3581586.1 oligosaccharide flippase family protein [Flavobacterium selenitireducens]
MRFHNIKTAIKSEKLHKFFIYGFGQAVNLISPIVVIPYIIGVVGEKGLGKAGMGMSLSYILIVVVDYSSYIKSVREVALNRQNPDVLKATFATVYLAKFVLLLFVLALICLSCYLIPYFRSERALYLLSMCIVLGQFLNPTWFLQGIEDFVSISAINILSKAIYLLGVLFFVVSDFDYVYVNMWLGLGLVIPSLFVLIRLVIRYNVGWENLRLSSARELIKRDFTFCISQLLFAFRQYSPILIIGTLAGTVVAGQFKVIEQIVMLFRTYFQTVFKFSLGMVSYEINTDFKRGLRTWKRLNGYNLLAVSIGLLLTGFFADEVLRFFKVSSIFLPLYHSLLLPALGIPFFIGITLAQEQLLFSFDKNRDYIRITVFITAMSTLLLCLGLWKAGLYGALLSLLVSEVVLCLVYHRYLQPLLRQKSS